MNRDDLQQLIDGLWDFNDPAASAERFDKAVADAANPAARWELQTQVARALGLQLAFDQAHRALDEVQRRVDVEDRAHAAEVSKGADARVRLSLERGRIFNSCEQRDLALPLFEQAFEAALRICNDHLAIDAAHMLAIVHDAQGGIAEAMAWNVRALELATHSSQARAGQWRASLHNNMGWTLHARGDFAAALNHFEAALERRREQGDAREIRIATWCVARCLRSMNRIDEALRMQQAIAEQAHQAGQQPDGFSHEELGECLLASGRCDDAVGHFRHAFEVLSRDVWLVEREPARLARLKRLSGGGDG